MPVHHTVLLKLLPTLSAAQKSQLHITVMEGLKNTPGKNLAAGPPIHSERAGGYEYGIYREFVDDAEFQAYRVHPDHVALVAGALKESVETMVSFQIQA